MLVDRALKLSHPKFWQGNLNLIHDTMILNCYPEEFINRHLLKRKNQISSTSTPVVSRIEFDYKAMRNLPYIEQVHFPLLRLLKNLGINMVTNNKHNIASIVGSTKDKIPLLLNSKLVYNIPCNWLFTWYGCNFFRNDTALGRCRVSLYDECFFRRRDEAVAFLYPRNRLRSRKSLLKHLLHLVVKIRIRSESEVDGSLNFSFNPSSMVSKSASRDDAGT